MQEVSWFGLPFASSPWPVQVLIMLVFAALVWVMVWLFITRQAKSTSLSFSEHIWPAIKDSPIAVAMYRLGIYALAVAVAWVAFGRFA